MGFRNLQEKLERIISRISIKFSYISGDILWLQNSRLIICRYQNEMKCKTCNSIMYLGGKYLLFVSSCSVKMRGFSFLSLYKSVFIFQFLNVKMYNYGKQNTFVNFIIKKLKKSTISSKSIKTKFSRR